MALASSTPRSTGVTGIQSRKLELSVHSGYIYMCVNTRVHVSLFDNELHALYVP